MNKIPQLIVIAVKLVLTYLCTLIGVRSVYIQHLTGVDKLLNAISGHFPSLTVFVAERVYNEKIFTCNDMGS